MENGESTGPKQAHLRVVPKEGEQRTPQQIFDGAAQRIYRMELAQSIGEKLTDADYKELIRIQGELGNIPDAGMNDGLRGGVNALKDKVRRMEKERSIS